MKHFATMYNGTMISLFDEDSRQDGGEYSIKTLETVEQFNEWVSSGDFYARFEDEVYVKITADGDDWEAMTLTEANEAMSDPDSRFYTGTGPENAEKSRDHEDGDYSYLCGNQYCRCLQ